MSQRVQAEPLPRWRCTGWGWCTARLAQRPALHLQTPAPAPPPPSAPAEQPAPVERGTAHRGHWNYWETTELGIKYIFTSFSAQTWPGAALNPANVPQLHRSTAIIFSLEDSSPQDERPQYTLCPPSQCIPPCYALCPRYASCWTPLHISVLDGSLSHCSFPPTPDCSTESFHSYHQHLQPVICAPSAPLYLFDDVEFGHRGFLGSGFAHGQELPRGQNPEKAKGDPDQHSLLEAHRQVGIRTSKVGIILGAARTEHQVTCNGLALTWHTGQEPTLLQVLPTQPHTTASPLQHPPSWLSISALGQGPSDIPIPISLPE